jgi:hypothetical protein
MPNGILFVAAIFVIAVLVAIWPRSGPFAISGVSEAEDKAALTIMVRAVSPHVSKFGVANGWDNENGINANQASLDKFKEYVASVADAKQRSALERWCDVEQRSINDARTELKTGDIKAEDERRRKKYAEEDRRRDDALKLFPTPPR